MQHIQRTSKGPENIGLQGESPHREPLRVCDINASLGTRAESSKQMLDR